MFLEIGNKMYEITWIHITIVIGVLIIILSGLLSLFYLGIVDSGEKKLNNDIAKPVFITDKQTTTTLKPTTTTTATATTTTTVSVTTTTITEKEGFFDSFKKEKEVIKNMPLNCAFAGKGHDAVLMPSGFYYCRSTEKRVTIYVKGVEKTCCVTP